MNKTKIDWCDMSWNPVTGCLHGCPYCYARKIAKRFGVEGPKEPRQYHGFNLFEEASKGNPYPHIFAPTLHKYRLDEPVKKTKTRTIFVCSMADLFGEWVPDDWLELILKSCWEAPQHRYLFLTKNPERIERFIDVVSVEERGYNETIEAFKSFWFGTSVTSSADMEKLRILSELREGHRFLSIEPLLGPIELNLKRDRCPVCDGLDVYQENSATCLEENPYYCDECNQWEGKSISEMKPSINWVIIGAESGNRKDKVVPERKWIEDIVSQCRAVNVPVFMKSSLADIWGATLIQEFPWEV